MTTAIAAVVAKPFNPNDNALAAGLSVYAPILAALAVLALARFIAASHRRGMSRVRRTNVVDLDAARANRNVTVQGER